MKIIKISLLAVIFFLVTGCASLVAPPYSPDYALLDSVKQKNLQKISVGQFQPKDPNARVNKISLRGSSLRTQEQSFATYLENAIRSDLKEMGFFDESSRTVISATLLQNDIDVSGFSKGGGRIEVNVKVANNEKPLLDKNYLATTTFESSFAGAVAIPTGQKEYPNLVKALLQKIYSDEEFIRVLKK